MDDQAEVSSEQSRASASTERSKQPETTSLNGEADKARGIGVLFKKIVEAGKRVGPRAVLLTATAASEVAPPLAATDASTLVHGPLSQYEFVMPPSEGDMHRWSEIVLSKPPAIVTGDGGFEPPPTAGVGFGVEDRPVLTAEEIKEKIDLVEDPNAKVDVGSKRIADRLKAHLPDRYAAGQVISLLTSNPIVADLGDDVLAWVVALPGAMGSISQAAGHDFTPIVQSLMHHAPEIYHALAATLNTLAG